MALETWSPWGQDRLMSGVTGPSYDLKPPGEGWQITGSKQVRINNPKMGSGYMTKNIPIYSRMTAPPPPPPPPAPAPAPAQAPAPTQLPTNTYAPPPGPSMGDIASQFASQIAAMQQGLQQSLQQQASQFAQMQSVQQERMADLQQQMLQSQVQQQQRPEVAGVKTATGSAGDMMQIARKGVSGTFGRRGMRISGLNV